MAQSFEQDSVALSSSRTEGYGDYCVSGLFCASLDALFDW